MSPASSPRHGSVVLAPLTTLLRRLVAVWLLAMLTVALLPGLVGTAAAARSSKPKEIVVVGSKVKVDDKERPAKVLVEVFADRLLDDAEVGALHDAVPELLDDLCPRSGGDAERCTTAEIEAVLRSRLGDTLFSFADLDVDEFSVHVAARRDDQSAPLRMLAPVLLGYGFLRWRRNADGLLSPDGR